MRSASKRPQRAVSGWRTCSCLAAGRRRAGPPVCRCHTAACRIPNRDPERDSGLGSVPSCRQRVLGYVNPVPVLPVLQAVPALSKEDEFLIDSILHDYPRRNRTFLEKPMPGSSFTTSPGWSVLSLLSPSMRSTPRDTSQPPSSAICSVVMVSWYHGLSASEHDRKQGITGNFRNGNREIVLFDQGIHLQRVTRVDGLCRYAWTVLAWSCLSRQHAPFEHMHHPGPRLLCAPAHSASVLGVPVYKPSRSLTSRFRLARRRGVQAAIASEDNHNVTSPRRTRA